MERQFHNTGNYKRLSHNPTTTNNNTINKIKKSFHKKNFVSKNIAEGLKIDISKSPHFYLKPKLHKEGVPGRPVINSFNCRISKISEYVDYHLQPIVGEIQSYLKDTSVFLQKKVITIFLTLILTLNNFIFNSRNYLQTKGCQWESSMHHLTPIYLWINPFMKGFSLIYHRLIDDIFFI